MFLLSSGKDVLAATRTWDGGGGDNNWSTCANWDGPDTCPTSSDIATFNTTSTKNSTIDASFAGSVAGINIVSGYTGTITQARTLTIGASNYAQADGTFSGSSDSITINGSFTQTGGIFTSTSGTLSIVFSMSLTSGTFNHNNGTVAFIDTGWYQGAALTCSSAPFNLVSITKDSGNPSSGPNTFTISSNCTVPLGANPSVSLTSGGLTNNGTITVSSGTFTYVGNTTFANNGTFTHSGTGWTSQGGFTNGVSGVVTYSGTTASFYLSLDIANGTFPSGLTVTFNDGGWYQGSTLTCSGSPFTKIIITKDSGNAATGNPPGNPFTLSSGCSISLGADPTLTSTSGTVTNNGTIIVDSGTFTYAGGTTFTNNGTFTHSGSGWSSQGSFTNGVSGVVTYSGSAISNRMGFDVSNGTFPSGKDLTFTDSGGSAAGTLNCGSVTFASLTIAKTSGGTITPTSSCTITGNVSHTSGTVGNPASAFTWISQGNFTKSAATTLGGANLTLSLEGGSNTTISHSAGTFASKIQINKSGGAQASLSTALTTSTQTCTVVEGIFSIRSYNFTCGGTFTVEDGGTLRLISSETVTTPTLNSGSTVEYIGDGDGLTDSLTIKNYSYHHLTINSTDGASDTFSLPATLDINGNITITAGALDVTSTPYNLTVGGNWSNSGTFLARTGTVTLDGTSQSILGSTSFYNLTKSVSGADTLTFANNGTQTITGTMTLNGQSGSLLSLISNSPTNQWELDPQGTRTISYLDVEDSNNINATEISVSGLNITNGGNNTGWSFNVTPDAPSALGSTSYVDGSTGSDSTPTLSFTLSDTDGGDTVRYKIEIDDSSNFTSPLIDYRSDLLTQGIHTFTVGGAVGSGSYTLGSEGQTLDDGSYYWRVLAVDNSNATSSYATANSGSVAFIIDTSVIASPTPSRSRAQFSSQARQAFVENLIIQNGETKTNIPNTNTTQTSTSTLVLNKTLVLSRTLKKGLSGLDVKSLQEYLIANLLLEQGFNTGYFGSLTESAVKKLQCAKNIVCSGNPSTTGYGLVGPKTRSSIKGQ